jgi:hypothetical protein
MTQQTINVGSNELAGDGESLRTAFQKVNSNFTELYTTGGPRGYTGSQGSTGTVGFTGSQGSTGTVGFTGSIGSTGTVGFTGSQGSTGTVGFTGSQGSTGTVGFTGSIGSTGTVGYTGSASTATGYTGSAGATGYTGSVGTAVGDRLTTGSYSVVLGSTGKLTLSTAGIVRSGTDTAQVGYQAVFTQDFYGNTATGLVSGMTLVDVGSNAQLLALIDPSSAFGNAQYNLLSPITITYSDATTQTFTEVRITNTSSGSVIGFGYNATTVGHNFPITAQTANYVAATTAPEWTFGSGGTTFFPDGTNFGVINGPGTVGFAADPGSVFTIDTTVGNWRFGNGITFPNSTVQTTAYKSTSGSWTLATGSNTVSITVPLNGNYQMWVNGNIPNGIVEWNATVNVSNPNVPAIGSQYAWYYAAGNALVLTAIPDQIVGTAGVISTSTGYVGTTSNVFSFGITNNSTSSRVIAWGYTTL